MEDYYTRDSKISTTQGYPYHSHTPYLPSFIKRQNEVVATEIDVGWQKLFSGLFYSAQEPILYNYYLGASIYRFLWIRSFHSKILLSLTKDDSRITLTTIKLEFSSYDHEAIILSDEMKQLTIHDWEEFERLLENCSFWSMQPYIDNTNARDGSSRLVEGHLKEKYWFVNRWSPDDNFSRAGEFLINKSGLEEIIY